MNNKNAYTNKNSFWLMPFFSGLILLIFGFLILTSPLESFKTLTIVFGGIVLLTGILEIYLLLRNQKGKANTFSFLWGGLMNVILGILLIVNPKTILLIISIVMAFWLIFKGGEQIKFAFNLRKDGNPVWKRVLFFGIFILVVAAILLWHPAIIGLTIALWTSLAFIMIGVFRIYLAFRLKVMK